MRDLPLSLRIGGLGLGGGTLTAFRWQGDLLRFHEINPAVIRYPTAGDPLFSCLTDGQPGRFDVLVRILRWWLHGWRGLLLSIAACQTGRDGLIQPPARGRRG